MTLSAQQQRFVEEYLVDLHATQAAVRAGYSEKTAKEQASRLMKRPDIAEAIIVGRQARSTRTKINADWLLTRLADEAEADLSDLFDDHGALKAVSDWPAIWRQGLVAGIEAEESRAEGATTTVIRKVKLSDRVKRLELIGKHIGVQAFRDRVEHSGAVNVVIAGPDADL